MQSADVPLRRLCAGESVTWDRAYPQSLYVSIRKVTYMKRCRRSTWESNVSDDEASSVSISGDEASSISKRARNKGPEEVERATPHFLEIGNDMLADNLLPRLAWKDQMSLSSTCRIWRGIFLSCTRRLPRSIVTSMPIWMWELFPAVDTLALGTLNNRHNWQYYGLLCYALRERLKTLHLFQLDDIDMTLKVLTRLTTLKICISNFGYLHQHSECFSHLTNITNLALCYTHTKSVDMLLPLTRLTALDIRGSDIPCKKLGPLTQLEKLYLSGTNSVRASTVFRLPLGLRTLKIQEVGGTFVPCLSFLTNLEVLVLSGCDFFYPDDAAVISTLKQLRISGCAHEPRPVGCCEAVEYRGGGSEESSSIVDLEEVDISCGGFFNLGELWCYRKLRRMCIETHVLREVTALTQLEQLTALHITALAYECYRFLDHVLCSMKHLEYFTLCERIDEPAALKEGLPMLLEDQGYLRHRIPPYQTEGQKKGWYDLLYDFRSPALLDYPPSILPGDLISGLRHMSAAMTLELLKGQFIYMAALCNKSVALTLYLCAPSMTL